MSESRDVPDEWIAAAMSGDRTAVERVLGVIRPLVVRYCRARLGGTDRSSVSADDVAQEVCLAVLTALPGYRVQGRPFLAFVYGIASHKVIDTHRAASRNRTEPVAEIPDRMDEADGPENTALQVELSEEMSKLLEILPEKHREIITLRVVVGLSAEETAEAVGSTPGAVRVAQHRALTRLRKSMVEEDLIAAGQNQLAPSPAGATAFSGTTLVDVVPQPLRQHTTLPQVSYTVEQTEYTIEPTDELSLIDEKRLRSQLADFNDELRNRFDIDAGLNELRQIAEYRHTASIAPPGVDVEARLTEALDAMKEGRDDHEQPG